MTEHRVEYDTGQHARIVQDTGEPLDRLDNRDVRALVTALRLYYGDLQECGEHSADLEHVAKLSRRLASPDRTWVAEEASS